MNANLAVNAAASDNVVADNVTAWIEPFCNRYAVLMLDFAKWFLLLALVIGVAGAVIGLIRSLIAPAPAGEAAEAGGGLPTAIDAIKGMVEAFSKAPVWIAMFGGAILLLWLAGNAVPSYCTGQAAPGNEATANQSGDGGAGNASENGSAQNNLSGEADESGGGSPSG